MPRQDSQTDQHSWPVSFRRFIKLWVFGRFHFGKKTSIAELVLNLQEASLLTPFNLDGSPHIEFMSRLRCLVT